MKLSAPSSGTFTTADGTAFVPGADGTLDVVSTYVGQLFAMGWTAVPDSDVDTTSGRPASNLSAGMMWFDSTLGKPIWRNAANSGWVDATGTPA